jgi:mono/diheme cytochrome c family protein
LDLHPSNRSNIMQHPFPLLLAASIAATCGCTRSQGSEAGTASAASLPAATAADADALLARGEYLVRIAGCNDCHTPGYAEQQGNVDKALWLTGSPLGFRGPWGTTYPTNLRLLVAGMDEASWMTFSATLRTRPLMPDFAVRDMVEDDRRALYRFMRSLGPAGVPAPAFLPPGEVPATPHLDMVVPAPRSPKAG